MSSFSTVKRFFGFVEQSEAEILPERDAKQLIKLLTLMRITKRIADLFLCTKSYIGGKRVSQLTLGDYLPVINTLPRSILM